MRFLRALTCMLALLGVLLEAQDRKDDDLAKSLASVEARDQTVAAIVALGNARVPLLLAWTNKPPPNINVYELNVGLADAFGQLKAKEAIPFLIKNISIDRTFAVNTWLKSPETVEKRLAAAMALVRIGDVAGEAVLKASVGPTSYNDRLAIIFVMSRMKDVPGARTFLQSTFGKANLERAWAETGLKQIDSHR